jgi:hypothetical protein
MADFDDIIREIETQLETQKRKILNRNAFDALIAAVGGALTLNPAPAIDGLRKVFLGRGEAIDAERQKITQQAILELVCKIDDALTHANTTVSTTGSPVTVAGLVEVIARDGDHVVGANISSTAGPVTFEPGTRIRTETHNVPNVTGLQIGSLPNHRKEL